MIPLFLNATLIFSASTALYRRQNEFHQYSSPLGAVGIGYDTRPSLHNRPTHVELVEHTCLVTDIHCIGFWAFRGFLYNIIRNTLTQNKHYSFVASQTSRERNAAWKREDISVSSSSQQEISTKFKSILGREGGLTTISASSSAFLRPPGEKSLRRGESSVVPPSRPERIELRENQTHAMAHD